MINTWNTCSVENFLNFSSWSFADYFASEKLRAITDSNAFKKGGKKGHRQGNFKCSFLTLFVPMNSNGTYFNPTDTVLIIQMEI